MVRALIEEIFEPPGDPIGGASGDKRKFSVQFLAKSNNVEWPYTVANEIVATQIGIVLGLHVPSVLDYTIGGETFVLIQTIDRAPSMTEDIPATAKALAEFVATHPEEVHGSIIFDLFVANNDRAFGPLRRNLLLDQEGKLLLYDQGNSCFYRHRPSAKIVAGVSRLRAVERSLPSLFDMDHKQNTYRQFLTSPELVDRWCSRIEHLPDFVIENAVNRIPGHLSCPTPQERQELIGFLQRRRRYLREHIHRWKRLFPGLAS